jgi:hypothetical protein
MPDWPSLMMSSKCSLVWSLLSGWCNFGGIPLAVEIPCSWLEQTSGAPDGCFPHLPEHKTWALGKKQLCGRSPQVYQGTMHGGHKIGFPYTVHNVGENTVIKKRERLHQSLCLFKAASSTIDG